MDLDWASLSSFTHKAHNPEGGYERSDTASSDNSEYTRGIEFE